MSYSSYIINNMKPATLLKFSKQVEQIMEENSRYKKLIKNSISELETNLSYQEDISDATKNLKEMLIRLFDTYNIDINNTLVEQLRLVLNDNIDPQLLIDYIETQFDVIAHNNPSLLVKAMEAKKVATMAKNLKEDIEQYHDTFALDPELLEESNTKLSRYIAQVTNTLHSLDEDLRTGSNNKSFDRAEKISKKRIKKNIRNTKRRRNRRNRRSRNKRNNRSSRRTR